MAIVFNDNIQPNAPKSLDSRYTVYESGQTRAYNNTLEVLNKLDLAVRHKGLTVLVGSNEYWFKDGILDNNLVQKTVIIDTSDLVTISGNQYIAGAKGFSSTLTTVGINTTGDISITGGLFTNGVSVLNRDQNDSRYIQASPNTPQTANINLNGTISNTGFQVQANGQTFWRNIANTAFIVNISDANGLSLYNKPLNLFGSTSQKMQLRNDDTGLVISNTSNQTKFKISDLGTVTLSQVPSTGVAGAPTLVRNPTTGNIELGVSGDSNAVLLTGDQSIAGNKSFSNLSNSTVTGNLNITSGSIQDNTKSNEVAYWDGEGFLSTTVIPVYTASNGIVKIGTDFQLTDSYVPLSTVGRSANQIVRRDPNGDVVSGRLIIAGQDGGATDSTNFSSALQVNNAFNVEDTTRSARLQLGNDGDLVLRTFSGTAGLGFWADGLRVRNTDQRVILSAPPSVSSETLPKVLTRNATTGLIETITNNYLVSPNGTKYYIQDNGTLTTQAWP